MSEITPIRIEASGMGVFEKTELVERQVSDTTPAPKSGSSCGPSDDLRLSKKMRKHLEKKTSLIKKQVISQPEVDRQDVQQNRAARAGIDLRDLQNPRSTQV